MRLTLALCLCATVAPTPSLAENLAQTLMTPQEFDGWSTGKILDYSMTGVEGDIYSREEHLSGRRTRLLIDGECSEGLWHVEGDAICFVYPAYEGTHCWHFWRQGPAVRALPTGSLPGSLPDLVTPSDSPLACPGPDVGV